MLLILGKLICDKSSIFKMLLSPKNIVSKLVN
jgi:hypothetical protein